MTSLEEYKAKIRERGYEGPLLATVIRKTWQVTSCWRQSSASISSPPWYEEIFVWLLDDTEYGRTRIGDATGRNYFDVVKEIYETGDYKEQEK